MFVVFLTSSALVVWLLSRPESFPLYDTTGTVGMDELLNIYLSSGEVCFKRLFYFFGVQPTLNSLFWRGITSKGCQLKRDL